MLALKDLEAIGRAINRVAIGVQVPTIYMIGKCIVVYQLGRLQIENEIILEGYSWSFSMVDQMMNNSRWGVPIGSPANTGMICASRDRRQIHPFPLGCESAEEEKTTIENY